MKYAPTFQLPGRVDAFARPAHAQSSVTVTRNRTAKAHNIQFKRPWKHTGLPNCGRRRVLGRSGGFTEYRVYVDLISNTDELYPPEPACTAIPCEDNFSNENNVDPGQNNEGWSLISVAKRPWVESTWRVRVPRNKPRHVRSRRCRAPAQSSWRQTSKETISCCRQPGNEAAISVSLPANVFAAYSLQQ